MSAATSGIGTKRTWSVWLTMSALEGKAELEQTHPEVTTVIEIQLPGVHRGTADLRPACGCCTSG